jgi:CP family cyanate transporter-like MFS transporter
MIGPALTALNVAQLPASLLLMPIADRMTGTGWAYAACGSRVCLGISGLLYADSDLMIAAASFLGFVAATALVLTLALPVMLCSPNQVAATTAGMFTLSYTIALITPVVWYAELFGT